MKTQPLFRPRRRLGETMVEIVCHSGRDALVIELVGELPEVFAPLLRSCLVAAADSGERRIVVDLGAATHVDEAIVAMLEDVARSVDGRGVRLRVESAPVAVSATAGAPRVAH